jgi:peptidyl-prolyl cis-trans isomerase C
MIHRCLHRIGWWTLISLACLSVGGLGLGCRQKSSPQTAEQGAEPNASEANQVAVVVNGVSITNGRVDAMVEEQFKPYADRSSQWPPEFVAQRKREVRRGILEKVVIEILLDEQVKLQGIAVSDEELQQRISDLAAKRRPPMSGEEFLAKVQSGGMSAEKFRADLRGEMARSRVLERQRAGKADVTDEQAKAYYENHVAEFTNPERVRVSHILIPTDVNTPGVDVNQVKVAAKAKAEDLLAKIRAGADFAELAKANSACPSAANGGDVGYFKRGDMELPFEKVAFELKPNQISDVVETRYGFHIIKGVDHKAAGRASFEEAKPAIVQQLSAEKVTVLSRDYIESLKAKAKIQYGSK